MLAFLRKLKVCLFEWGQPNSRGDMSKGQIILTQAASDLSDGHSSNTNKDIACEATLIYGQTFLPIFPQQEVRTILEDGPCPIVGEATSKDSNKRVESTEYMGSDGVARLQKKYCDKHKITCVIVVAAYPHAQRAIMIYEKLGLEVIVPPWLPKAQFEKDMAQWRWQRAITAYPYEFFIRLFFLFTGRI